MQFLTAVAILLGGNTLTINAHADQMQTLTFGFWRTLSESQVKAYYASLQIAVLDADNGQPVKWYVDNASGVITPVHTRPTGSGYCRRLHVQVIAHNVEKFFQETVCLDNSTQSWRWVRE